MSVAAEDRDLRVALRDAAHTAAEAIARIQLMLPIVEAARKRAAARARIDAGDLTGARELQRIEHELAEFVRAYEAAVDRRD